MYIREREGMKNRTDFRKVDWIVVKFTFDLGAQEKRRNQERRDQ